MNIKTTTFILIIFTLVTFANVTYAQTGSVPPGFRYQFLASSADSCGAGGIQFFGYQYASENEWSVYGRLPNYNISGGYLIFSWTLSDEGGQLASGSWNSQTGASTGGTYGSSFGFLTSRIPVGEIRFQALGQVQGTGGYGTLCQQSFNATTFTTVSSGGYVHLTVDTSKTYVFQNKQSGLVIQIAGSSSADYEPATQDAYVSASNQNWTLSSGGSYYYIFSNNATGKALYSDFQSGNPTVYQLSSPNRAWRFISVGDGSYYIVYDVNYAGGVYTSYAMRPANGTSQSGNSIETIERTNESSQHWFVTELP